MAAHCPPRLPDGPGGLRAARDRGGNEVRKVLVLGHQLVDGEDLRLRLSELRPGLFIERAGRARVEAHGVLDGILKFFHRDSL